ncbi:hypothetical protein QYF61_025830, partial [Mycteria americana]
MAPGKLTSCGNLWIVHSYGADSRTHLCNDHVLSGSQGRHLLCI